MAKPVFLPKKMELPLFVQPLIHKARLTVRVLFFFLLANASLAQAQQAFKSNLPIIKINTNGWLIFDEPKIPATLSLIDNAGNNSSLDSNYALFSPIGIELRGKTSQLLSDKKPYAFELRDAKGRKRPASLLGMPEEHDWVMLAPFADKTLLRDLFGFGLANRFTALGYVPRMKPIELFINDEYKGVYILGEKIKRDETRLNIADFSKDTSINSFVIKIDKESGFLFNEYWTSHVPPRHALDRQVVRFLFHHPKPENVTAKQAKYIKQWIRNFEDTLLSPNFANPNGGYRNVLDVPSFIDFFLMNELVRNVDGLRISTFFHKNDDRIDPKLHAGPVWDYNLSLGNADYCNGYLTEGWAYDFNKVCGKDYWLIPFWWERLREDPAFKRATAERWATLRKGELSDKAISQLLDELTDQFKNGPQQRNFAQWDILGKKTWPNYYTYNTWDEEVGFLLKWTLARAAWLDVALAQP